MLSRFDLPEGARKANMVRAAVAMTCVLGLTSLMWLHSGLVGGFGELTTPEIVGATMVTSLPDQLFLPAPTSDPSLPSLDSTFRRTDVAPADEAPAPTF